MRLDAILLIFLAAQAFSQPGTENREPGTGRPNVLFLCVDDMNDWVGFLGGYPGKVHTPNLDRLAARGTAFTNAHCTAPVCCPSRVSVLSGLLPTTTGIYNNQHWWKANLPGLRTIPLHFRENGYHTIGAGKIYHHPAGNNPPDQWHHFQRYLSNDNAWIRHGSALYPWTKPKPTPPEFPYSGLKLYSGEADWGVLPLPEREYDDSVTADYAIKFLNSLATPQSPNNPITNNHSPFFLACGIFHPHMPWYVPQRFLDLYPLDQVVVPPDKPEDLEDVPEPGKRLALRKADDLKRIRAESKWPAAVRHYLASISFADAQAGRVLDALEKSPAAQNTIIVLWSDHGWHLGEKGHWHKRTLWEEATRVPFIIVAPGCGKPGQRCEQAVSLIHIFSTLIELCGLPKIENLDGISLVPWLKNPESLGLPPAITVEETGHIAIRTKFHRYIHYKNGDEELYDHRSDPDEWHNLADKDEWAELKTEIAKWIPKKFARPALPKSAFHFDPKTFTFTNKQTGQTIRGGAFQAPSPTPPPNQ